MFIGNVVIRFKCRVDAENEEQAEEMIWGYINDIRLLNDTDKREYLEGYDEIENIERVD